ATEEASLSSAAKKFIAHLPFITAEESFRLVEVLRIRIAGMNWQSQGIDRQITESFGIATVHATDRILRAPIDRADEALYSAKTLG
ncbi:diguanylate cyclase domain-containing protein, partial [Rhizobium leguminosarum]|uniref:diguanylate cyclase domain-containing protein n=1 Tax=Rhizobium leguminosarum TaxID=384 RepID=UPI003F98AE67